MRKLFLLLPLLGACAPKAKVPPAAVVEAFYAHLLTYPVTGAPNSGDLPRIAPFLSDSLLAELTRAGARRDSAAALHPDEKPPFAEGDLFTSMFEGPSAFSVMATREEPAAVLVHFEHSDVVGTSRTTEWVDTVLVVRRDTSWAIDDIAYGGTWPMANKGTLRQNLK